jgi:hypothetical protein
MNEIMVNLNPTPEAEVQGLHAALGALCVSIPVSLWALHPIWNFCFGHPKLVGSFIGLVWATVKEFVWDQDMEDSVTRGSNWRDWSFYVVGIVVASGVLFL